MLDLSNGNSACELWGRSLRCGAKVRVLDLRLEAEDALARELASFKPHIVGTTSMTTDVYQALAEFERDWVDVVVQGEGEQTFIDIITAWAEQRQHGDRRFSSVPGLRYRPRYLDLAREHAREQRAADALTAER